jgi:NADH:ubiquinone oxidoreductase subunit H
LLDINRRVIFSNNLNTQYSNKFRILILVQTSLLYLSTLSESNRTPFDLIERESELVSGFNLEYRRLRFTFLFLGEYCILWIITRLLITLIIFYSTININRLLFTLRFVIIRIYIRRTLPRFKYNRLIILFWSSLVFSVILLLIFHIS